MELNEIYLGDAYELIKQVPDNSVDLIVTDPPYEIGEIRNGTGFLKDRKGGFVEELNDGLINNGINISILGEMVRAMKRINIYIWCNKAQIIPYLEFFTEKGCNFEIIVWTKKNPAPFCASHYLVDKEYCLYFWETGAKLHVTHDRGRTVYFTGINIDDKTDYGHPTIKPVQIIENLIVNSSNEGDVVLDPFIGSGTTAVAAKGLKRNYIGFELNPKWHKVACDRVKGITAKEAKAGMVQERLF